MGLCERIGLEIGEICAGLSGAALCFDGAHQAVENCPAKYHVLTVPKPYVEIVADSVLPLPAAAQTAPTEKGPRPQFGNSSIDFGSARHLRENTNSVGTPGVATDP
jgi:hypothetical protein